jgi:hypothetical protein
MVLLADRFWGVVFRVTDADYIVCQPLGQVPDPEVLLDENESQYRN